MQPMGSPAGDTWKRANVVSAGHSCTSDKDQELGAGWTDREAAAHAAQDPSWLRLRGSTLHTRFREGQAYTEKGLG